MNFDDEQLYARMREICERMAEIEMQAGYMSGVIVGAAAGYMSGVIVGAAAQLLCAAGPAEDFDSAIANGDDSWALLDMGIAP
jgi:hypothetical protein